MKIPNLLGVILGGAMLATACGTTAADREAVPDAAATSGAKPTTAQGRPAQAKVTVEKAAVANYREVTIPSGTALNLSLTSSVASDTSKVEDSVGAELSRAVTVDGREVVPAGATVGGQVTVKTSIRAGQVVLEVIDSGIGIEPSAVPHIFERFRGRGRVGRRCESRGRRCGRAARRA